MNRPSGRRNAEATRNATIRCRLQRVEGIEVVVKREHAALASTAINHHCSIIAARSTRGFEVRREGVVAVDDSSKTGTDEVDGATHSTGNRAIPRATRRPVVRAVYCFGSLPADKLDKFLVPYGR